MIQNSFIAIYLLLNPIIFRNCLTLTNFQALFGCGFCIIYESTCPISRSPCSKPLKSLSVADVYGECFDYSSLIMRWRVEQLAIGR